MDCVMYSELNLYPGTSWGYLYSKVLFACVVAASSLVREEMCGLKRLCDYYL